MKKKSHYAKYCCGCGLCSDLFGGSENEKGYFRPNEKQIDIELAEKICYCDTQCNKLDDGMWGKYLALYYGYSLNAYRRKMASSGGVLTEICIYLLNSKQVDGVIQIHKNPSDPMKTEVVLSTSIQDVVSCCGSRYTASAGLLNLKEIMKDNEKYALVAKPCDISVIRNYMQMNPELNDRLILLTFFCGGTPSKQANTALLTKMGTSHQKISDFIYRGNGWPGLTTAINSDGTKCEIEYEESWGKTLGRDLQEICRFCWDGVGSDADISCGDGWYVENGEPMFIEAEGRNIIFARTEKGNNILESLFSQNLLYLEKAEESDLILMQPGQYMRKAAMLSRIMGLRILFIDTPKFRLINLWKFATKISFKVNVKMFLGTVKRVLQGKIK